MVTNLHLDKGLIPQHKDNLADQEDLPGTDLLKETSIQVAGSVEVSRAPVSKVDRTEEEVSQTNGVVASQDNQEVTKAEDGASRDNLPLQTSLLSRWHL